MEKKNIYILLIVTRIFDSLTTYIAGKGDLSKEMNVLVRVYNMGWVSLIVSNLIGILIISFLIKIHTNKYYLGGEQIIINKKNISLNEYLGILYFGKKIKFIDVFFAKMRYKITFYSFIYLFAICTIIVSFLIGINNLLTTININLLFCTNSFWNKNIVNFLNVFVFIICFFIYHIFRFNKFKNSN